VLDGKWAEEFRVAEPEVACKCFRLEPYWAVTRDPKHRISCKAQRAKQHIHPLFGRDATYENANAPRARWLTQCLDKIGDRFCPFRWNTPIYEPIANKLANRDKSRHLVLEPQHEAMEPEEGSVGSRLASIREATVCDSGEIDSILASMAYGSFSEHESVRTPEPEVVNGHYERNLRLVRGEVDSGAKRRIWIVEMYDVGMEVADGLRSLLLAALRIGCRDRHLYASLELSIPSLE
jgi:hypothetical protein